MSLRQSYFSLLICIVTVICLFITVKSVRAIACAGNCSGYAYSCNAGLSCSPGNKCGVSYATCVGSACVADNAWDVTSPCDTADKCTAGTTRTAKWVNGMCSTTCGVGTTTQTCTCGNENTCAAPSCTSPAGSCGATNPSAACCAHTNPNAPTSISTSGSNCSKDGTITITWTHKGWGCSCGTSNSFSIMEGKTVLAQDIQEGVSPYNYNVTLSPGVHTIQVCASNGAGPAACSVASNPTVIIDTTAPSVPGGETVAFVPDGACADRYKAKYSWGTVSDSGCAGMDPLPYWSQGADSPTIFGDGGFTSLLNGWNNSWNNVTSTTSAQSYAPGTNLYFHVRSHDAAQNQSAWSPTGVAIVPTPIPYPTIHVGGAFSEDINGSCTLLTTLNASSLTLTVANPNTGVTISNLVHSSSAYSFNVAIDNSKGLCTSSTTTITLSASYPGYTSVGWLAGDVCGIGAIENSRTFTVGDNKSLPLFFKYGGATLTGGGWFKLKDTSFNSRITGKQNYIPSAVAAFDSDDSLLNYMIIGSAGTVIGSPDTTYSPNNWNTSGYTQTNDVSYQKYIDYIKGRKDFTTLSGTITGASFPSNGIYIVSDKDVILDQAWFAGKNIVLVISEGKKATFNTDFKPTGSVAVLASLIEIKSTVTEIDAILIGQTVTSGASTTGLKIKGNLIDESALTMERTRTDAHKPSLFVVFDSTQYMNLLPYLSTSTYDWRQIQ